MIRAALVQISRSAPARTSAALARLRRWHPWSAATLVLLSALSGYRAQLVDTIYGTYTGCHGCLNASVVASDAAIIAVVVAVIALARCALPYALRWIVAAGLVAGVAFFCADIVVFRLLSQRLLLVDVLHMGGDATRFVSVVAPWLGHREGALALGTMAAACIAAWLAVMRVPAQAQAAPWALAAIGLAAASCALPRAEYLHDLAYLDVWHVNRQVDPGRPYSEDFHRLNAKLPAAAATCDPGLAQRTSIVVVAVESLSAYHSRLVSGLRDDTPELDALAREGTWSRTFHANGFSTEGGLIALLTGRVPIPTAGRRGSVMAFTDVKDDFHRWLAARGYATHFFTTGDLDTGRRRQWLRAIGIGQAEGAEHPFYRRMPRASFGAAEDGALVDRFLAWYDKERRAGPFMATLLTVATHPPFTMPGHGIVGEDEMVREADRQVARLARSLRARGFFGDGVMIVVGDHRAMTPIPREERAVLGSSAEVRVFALALGRTGLAPGELHGNYQQADLIPSLRHLLSARSCRDEWQGRFLGAQPGPAEFVVHADPLQRNELTVIEDPREYRIRLDGDDTRFVDAAPREWADALLRRVNAERMSRMAEFSAAARR